MDNVSRDKRLDAGNSKANLSKQCRIESSLFCVWKYRYIILQEISKPAQHLDFLFSVLSMKMQITNSSLFSFSFQRDQICSMTGSSACNFGLHFQGVVEL